MVLEMLKEEKTTGQIASEYGYIPTSFTAGKQRC